MKTYSGEKPSIWQAAVCFLVLLSLAACSNAAGSPTPLSSETAVPQDTDVPLVAGETFKNPVITANFPDPFVLKYGDLYYAYATNGASKNVQLATSPDLIKWELKGDAMPALAKWVKISSADVWAPEVIQIGEKFVLYYTARDKASGKQCVGVATSDSPEGKFKDTNEAPLVCQTDQGGTIDPAPFSDGEKLYLYYKNDGNCCGYPTYIYVQEMAPDGLSLVGEATSLVRNDAPWEGGVIEAPTMVNHDGSYFLFYSGNDYGGMPYAVGYAACETVTGPCKDAPENPILKSQVTRPLVVGPGHQTVILVEDEWWLVYHVWQMLPSGLRGSNRQVWLDQIDWSSGKPDILGPTTGVQEEPGKP
jgi:beta-xylosidase